MAWRLKQDGERLFVAESDLSDSQRQAFERALRIDDSQREGDYVEYEGRWWKVEPPPEDMDQRGYWLREATQF